MDTKVHLIGLDQNTATRYARVIRNQGISRIEIDEDRDLALTGFDQNSGIVFIGYNSADVKCTEILEVLRSEHPQVDVVLVTQNADIRTVVDALRYGALDHVVKGEWDEAHVESAIQRIIRMKDLLNADKGELWKQISTRIHAA